MKTINWKISADDRARLRALAEKQIPSINAAAADKGKMIR